MRGMVGNARGSEARKGQNLSCGVAARCFVAVFVLVFVFVRFTEASSAAVVSSPSDALVRAFWETFLANGGRAAAAAAAASPSKCRRNWSATCNEIHCAAFRTANEAGYKGRRVRKLSRALFGIEIRTQPGCSLCASNVSSFG